MQYDEKYYIANTQDRDRPALWFYERIWRRYCDVSAGPVLDFGCGVGYLARRLSDSTQVYGLEINPYAIEKIVNNAPDVKLVDNLGKILDSSLGSIISLHVLEHIPESELDAIGQQFLRVLRPGGRAVFAMPDLNGYSSKVKGRNWMAHRDPTHINLKGAEDWYRYFTERWQFKVVKYGADGYYDFPYGKSLFSRTLGDTLRVVRTGIQFCAGMLMLKPGDGEAVVFILEKSQPEVPEECLIK